jgi:S1-C subfamily serine protease
MIIKRLNEHSYKTFDSFLVRLSIVLIFSFILKPSNVNSANNSEFYTEAEFTSYLENNLEDLDQLEGIYTIGASFESLMSSNAFKVRPFKVDEFDRVYIIKNFSKADELIMYAFKSHALLAYIQVVYSEVPRDGNRMGLLKKKYLYNPVNIRRDLFHIFRDSGNGELIIENNPDIFKNEELSTEGMVAFELNLKSASYYPDEYRDLKNIFGDQIYSRLIDFEKFDYPLWSQLNEKEKILADLFLSYSTKLTFKRLFPVHSWHTRKRFSKTFSGTCFLIHKNYLLTNYHVIEEYIKRTEFRKKYQDYLDKVKYRFNDYFVLDSSYFKTDHFWYKNNLEEYGIIKIGQESSINVDLTSFNESYKMLKASIVDLDRENDLALIKLPDSMLNLPRSEIQISNDLSLGQEVIALGFPLSDVLGSNVKLSSGIVSSLGGINGEKSKFTTNLNINPGNSGGPVFNNKGELVGVINARLDDGQLGLKTENISFGISTQKILDFLKKNNIPVQKKIPNKPNIGTEVLAKKFVPILGKLTVKANY